MKNADSNENRVNDKVVNPGISTSDSTEKRLEKLEDQTKQMSEKLENMESDIQANKREVQYAINKLYSVRDINGLSDGSVSDN
jgi:TolA-binding protein